MKSMRTKQGVSKVNVLTVRGKCGSGRCASCGSVLGRTLRMTYGFC